MTIKNMVAKFATKSTLTKAMLGAVAAGALLFNAPAKSDAQVFVGFRYGRPAPAVVAPAPYVRYGYGYYGGYYYGHPYRAYRPYWHR